MPQIFTNLLNKTISGQGFTAVNVPPDSLSVRLLNLQPGTYVEIYGISWGVTINTQPPDTLDTASLQIIRNEIFDPNFVYGGQVTVDRKDVVWQDNLNQSQQFADREFFFPIRLDSAPNYLIIAGIFGDFTNPLITFNPALTVRGRIFNKDEQKTFYSFPR